MRMRGAKRRAEKAPSQEIDVRRCQLRHDFYCTKYLLLCSSLRSSQVIAPLPSFFVSEEGLNEWNRLNGIEPPEEEEDPEISPRTKAAKAAAKPPVGPQNPVEQYRLLSYQKVRSREGALY